MKKNSAWLVLALLVTLTNACETRSKKSATHNVAAFDPKAFTQGRIYQISSEQSEVKIFAYRGGALATLGHNHIITSNHISGKVYRHNKIEQSGFHIKFPVNQLAIDKPSERKAAGENFSSVPSASDISATRSNMLSDELLSGQQFPEIHITSVALTKQKQVLNSTIRINIKEATCDIQTPILLSENSKIISVNGEFDFSQQQCNLTPFSIMMGAIAVKDILKIKFHFHADFIEESSNLTTEI